MVYCIQAYFTHTSEAAAALEARERLGRALLAVVEVRPAVRRLAVDALDLVAYIVVGSVELKPYDHTYYHGYTQQRGMLRLEVVFNDDLTVGISHSLADTSRSCSDDQGPGASALSARERGAPPRGRPWETS